MPSLKVVEELGSRNIAVDCKVVMKIGEKAMEDPNEIGAASVDFTMFSGYVVLAYMWAQMAELAQRKLEADTGDAAFYQAKLATANFYFKRILPRADAHAQAALAGAATLTGLDESALRF
jgi:hypothetical protein